MEPIQNTAAAISKDHAPLEASQKQIQELDKRIQDLTQSVQVLRQSIEELKESTPATMSGILREIQTKHLIPDGIASPGEIQKFLENALNGVHAEIERLHEGRETLQAPLRLSETSELVQNIADHADLATKSAMALVSKGWSRDTLNSLRTEGNRFIRRRIDEYMAALSSQGDWNSFSEKIELVKKRLNEIQELSFLETSTFADIQSRIFVLRNQIVEALSQLDPRDFVRLPSVFCPSSPLPPDLLYSAFSHIPNILALLFSTHDSKEDLMNHFLDEGDLTRALEMANEFKDRPFVRSQGLFNIVQQMVKRGDCDKALALANEISDKNSAIFREALVSIGSKLATDGTFKSALEVASQISNQTRRAIVISAIASAMTKKGTLEESIKSAKELTSTVFSNLSIVLNDAILAQFSAKKAKKGNIQEALDDASKIKDENFKGEAFSIIAQETARRGDTDGALQLAQSVSDEKYRSEALSLIAQEMATRGDTDGALELVQSISDENCIYQALSIIAQEMAKRKMFDKAFEVVDQIDVNSYSVLREQALVAIGDEFLRNNQFDELLGRAREVDFSAFASKLAARGDVEKALRIIESSDDDLVDKPVSFYSMALEIAKAGNFQEALRIANLIPDTAKWNRDNSICDISLEMAKLGRFDEALALLVPIEASPAKERTVNNIRYLQEKARVSS